MEIYNAIVTTFISLFGMIFFIWLVILSVNLKELSEKVDSFKRLIESKNYYDNSNGVVENNQEVATNNDTYNIEADINSPQENTNEEAEDVLTDDIYANQTQYDKFQEELKGVEIKDVESKKSTGFEALFMGNLFNKIGAIAILIGVAILVKLTSAYIVFTDEMKIALGFISGFAMFYASYAIRLKPKMQTFSEVLTGTGFGALLITLYCATSLMHIFSVSLATTIGCLIIVAMYFIADKQKTVSLPILALIGGYLNPYFINPNITPNFLFAYLLFLNILSVIFVYRNGSKNWVNISNLSLTALTMLCARLFPEYQLESAMFYITGLWLMYLLFDYFVMKKGEERATILNVQTVLNAIFFITLAICYMFKDITTLGYTILIVAILYVAFGIVCNERLKIRENIFFYVATIPLYVATICLCHNDWMIVAWAVEAWLIAEISMKFGFEKLSKLSFVFLISSLFKTLASSTVNMTYDTLVFNTRTIYFLMPVVFGGLMTNCYSRYKVISANLVAKFISVMSIYIYLFYEITSGVDAFNQTYYLQCMLYSLAGCLFAINMRLMSTKENDIFDVCAKILSYLALIVLFVTDLFNQKAIMPVFNVRLLCYSAAIANIIFALKKSDREWLKYLAVVVGFSYIHSESANIVHNSNILNDVNWLISLNWIIYTGIISLIGIFKNKKYLKISGIWLGITVIIRLFIFDFSNLDMIFKLVAFLLLGIVLMVISYFYNKRSK